MWYQHGVRILAVFAAAALVGTGCGGAPEPGTAATPTTAGVIDPVRIDRARAGLPAGYEVTDAAGRHAPSAQWGFRDGWIADPPVCGVLADPGAAAATGWSASGPGGIVFAVVADFPAHPDEQVLAGCDRWTLTGGRTTGAVVATPGPPIDGATTVAMSAAATTVVEGGTETRSHAETVSAYLDDHVVVVTVVTDPGAADPQLGPDFAAGLIAKTVAELRG